jgi:molybdopterin-containing oxidoreductase family iron-sulfur binding subunit
MTAALSFRSALCTGCLNCVLACKQENRTGPGVSWLKLERFESRSPDRIWWELQTCLHCPQAPCVSICPAGALRQSDEGVVVVDEDACVVGCQVCVSACDYDAIQIEPEAGYFGTELERMTAALPHQSREPSKISLCTLCTHRSDGSTACVLSCPTAALSVQPAGAAERIRLA